MCRLFHPQHPGEMCNVYIYINNIWVDTRDRGIGEPRVVCISGRRILRILSTINPGTTDLLIFSWNGKEMKIINNFNHEATICRVCVVVIATT